MLSAIKTVSTGLKKGREDKKNIYEKKLSAPGPQGKMHVQVLYFLLFCLVFIASSYLQEIQGVPS